MHVHRATREQVEKALREDHAVGGHRQDIGAHPGHLLHRGIIEPRGSDHRQPQPVRLPPYGGRGQPPATPRRAVRSGEHAAYLEPFCHRRQGRHREPRRTGEQHAHAQS